MTDGKIADGQTEVSPHEDVVLWGGGKGGCDGPGRNKNIRKILSQVSIRKGEENHRGSTLRIGKQGRPRGTLIT